MKNKMTVPAAHITNLSPPGTPEKVLKKMTMNRLVTSHMIGLCAGQALQDKAALDT